MSTQPQQVEAPETGDGDGEDEVSVLACFLVHLARAAEARGAGVGIVMQGLITEALKTFEKEFEDGE